MVLEVSLTNLLRPIACTRNRKKENLALALEKLNCWHMVNHNTRQNMESQRVIYQSGPRTQAVNVTTHNVRESLGQNANQFNPLPSLLFRLAETIYGGRGAKLP